MIGVDGTASALRLGRAASTRRLRSYLMGMRAIEDSKKALAGEKVPEFDTVPTLVLTKDVIEVNKEPMLQYVK